MVGAHTITTIAPQVALLYPIAREVRGVTVQAGTYFHAKNAIQENEKNTWKQPTTDPAVLLFKETCVGTERNA